jgi:hypothetical protein
MQVSIVLRRAAARPSFGSAFMMANVKVVSRVAETPAPRIEVGARETRQRFRAGLVGGAVLQADSTTQSALSLGSATSLARCQARSAAG